MSLFLNDSSNVLATFLDIRFKEAFLEDSQKVSHLLVFCYLF